MCLYNSLTLTGPQFPRLCKGAGVAPSQAPASPSPSILGSQEIVSCRLGAHLRKSGLIPIPRGCDTGRGEGGLCLMARKRSLRTLHSQGPFRGHLHPEHSNLLWTQPAYLCVQAFSLGICAWRPSAWVSVRGGFPPGYLCMEAFRLSSTVSALRSPLSHV